MSDPLGDPALIDAPDPVASLSDRWGVPPVSVIDRRAGTWRARRLRWLSLGITSELGRDATAGWGRLAERNDFMGRAMRGEVSDMGPLAAGGVSVFDPVVMEVCLRWLSRPGDTVIDPFAGGSVRGVVAAVMGRDYIGIDIRPEQVAANRAQGNQICVSTPSRPAWIVGDATRLTEHVDASTADCVITCPPYGDLEVYSDDPADLSTMTYPDFAAAHAVAISEVAHALRPDRFAAWIISDIRDTRGRYRPLVADTVAAAESAGLQVQSRGILLDPVGAAAMRAERAFVARRTLTRVHQELLIMCKGSPARAARRLRSGQ